MPDEAADVFFEDGTRLGSELHCMYRQSAAIDELRSKFKINQIVPLFKKRDIGILSADFIAYEAYKYHFNRRTNPHIGLRKSFEAALKGEKKMLGEFFNEPQSIHQFIDILERAGILGEK